MNRALALALLLMLLAACAPRPVRDVEQPVEDPLPPDGPPAVAVDVSHLPEPVPRPEPLSAYGNHSPYEVFGQTYHVMTSADGYEEEGLASWYGIRFHGQPTSSGEPYDMHQLTAAHRTLPLPSWVEVERLDTGQRLIVRVNDRGPFHSDRIIDLSWAAAQRLGMVEAGTAPVRVRAITFDEPRQVVHLPMHLPVKLQIGAFGERERAAEVSRRLEQAHLGPVLMENAATGAGSVWRVRVGPIADAATAAEWFERVAALGLGRPQYVYP